MGEIGQEFAAHLDACGQCRSAVALDAAVTTALSADPVDPSRLPSGAMLVEWIEQRTARRIRTAGRLVPAALCAGLAAAAFLMIRLPGSGPTAPSPPAVSISRAPEAPLPALVVVDDEESGRAVLMTSPPL